MGRSKFPGKPSKHCHRKRVNVLPPTGELAHGSDSSSVTVIGSSKENKQDEDLSENEGESTAQTEKSKPHREQIPRKLSTSLCKNGRQRNFITKIRNKTPLKNSKAARTNLSKSLVRKEAPNFAGKFVLPTRSVHSSRVIKPNKRFIDLNESINVKKKVLTKRSLHKPTEEKSNETCSDTKDKMAFSNGHRVILRQARLKLPNQVGTQISFSTKLHNGPGTIICGVCGAVRYYRFVKQARKFNIYSCESCRKFISKQIKRQNVGNKSSNMLPCQTGQGTCYVPPVVRSQHWKIAKCAYRSRCPACWLKMCIKAYHLPLTLKQNLTQLLPKNMRGFDLSFNNSLPPILWQKNIENTAKSPEMLIKQRPVRFKPPQKTTVSTIPITSDVKRQKIDLKGPRVKHVCRSASIVLGQPLATFGSENDKKVVDSQETISDKSTISDNSKISDTLKTDSPSVTDEELVSNSSFKSVSEKTILPRKERTRSTPTVSNKEVSNIPPSKELQLSMGILLDYSQELNYDNRYKYGFSVITSKTASTSAICYFCGSAGLEEMLICSVCCEPYHTFCIESFGIRINSDENWMCIRCVPCQNCKGFDRTKVSCPKCLKIYHTDCFNSKEDSSNSKMLCKECRRCHDCGTATAYNLASFPGNMPFCLNCLNKRKVGMYCPICQHSFEENNISTKMLECSKCKKWVHSECEKLTSEQYDILKLLPISENFTCSHCLKASPAAWRRSVQSELYHSFNQVLRLLIKNKTARSILKQVGIKGSHFRRHLLTDNLDIDNNNYKKDIDKIYSFEECEKPQKNSNSSFNTLIDIKNRLCEYSSVKKFNNDMKEALKTFHSEQMFVIYKNIFQNVFPWFSQSHEAAEDIPLSPYCHTHSKHRITLEKNPSLPDKDLDNRICSLCHNTGDRLRHEESRLLYCGNNIWVHANCAYWSIDVYEELDNHLQNVTETIEKSREIKCSSCNKIGASLQCHICRNESYHFVCARKASFNFKAVNKMCYCSKHPLDSSQSYLKIDEDFNLNRSLFVEHYSKENIRSEPENVNCSIGSLNITNLGKIEPFISDTADAIIPTGFVCYRIFWSTVEPWRLITYVIRTSVQNPNITTLTVDKNFTVDHTLEKVEVEKAMKEVKDWQKIYEKKPDEIDYEDEEEKNGAELLSPELTDTILEDLPHDILDGISVQDIFPNFSYEDMLNLENSNTESIAESLKKAEDEDSTVDTPDFKSSGREFNRTKSDPGLKSRVPPLSLTLSYKLDSTLPPITKKRKISKEPSNNMLLLQVDGAFDDSSSSECDSPIGIDSINPWSLSEEPVTCEKCQCTYRTQASYKRHLDTCEVLCTSESDSENAPEQDIIPHAVEDIDMPTTQPIEVTVQVNEPTQPVLIQAYESYQSQVHTSVVNVVPPDATPAPQPQSVTVQPTITIADPQPTSATISIPVPLCVGPSLTPQIVQPSIEFQQVQQTQAQPMTLQQVQQVLVQRQQPTRREPVVLQPIQPTPTPGFVPFVEAFGQSQTNQGVQYVQIAPQVQPQTQLLQIRSDGNVIGILPSIQPTTVIVQQPQQLVLDSSGTFGWTQQPQPQIYYGFETIVQNTVMQSQQFLPTPVPGVLTANSSYSTTTQVFQTSKLEPVLDVSSNSFVLVNPSQIEIPQQYSQNQPAAVVTSQNPTIIYSQPPTTQKPIATVAQNCINLPTAPFVSDQNIPMNIVPPIPKPPTSHGRPMSRVLPMPTSTIKTSKKIADITKMFPDAEKPPQSKIEENKFIFSKDLVKITDSPKSRNRKFEILDYKIIKSRPGQNTECKQIYRIEEKPFKEFEPIEKLPKLSKYEPLKEIEKVKIDMFNEPIKTLKILDKEKYLKLATIKNFDKLESQLKNFDTTHMNNSMKTIELKPTANKFLERNTHKEHIENRIQKCELQLNQAKMLNSSFIKNGPDISIRKPPPILTIPHKKITIPPPVVSNNLEPEMTKQKILETKTLEVKQSHEKCLDMPKLDNFEKIEAHINLKDNFNLDQNKLTKSSSIPKFDIQPHNSSIQNISPNSLNKSPAVVVPLRSDKSDPYANVEEKQKLTDKEPLAVITEPIPKQPKKESDCYGAPSILYTVENKEGFKYSSTSISDCWAKVWEAVQNARAAHNMPLLPTDGKQLKSVQLIGLKSSHVKYLIEQLPGASKCVKYKTLFNFTPHPLDTVDSSTHGFGAIRCQPHKNRNTDPNDMFSWLSSKHRQPFISPDSQIVQSRRVNTFPMAMKFRNLKLTSRWSVGVYRSKIHGKGLFCLRDIEAGEMVIEYAGEVIRSILTDKREKFYNSKGIGCYMFRVDDNFVVDATMKGNAARFINHSCDPNCYSKVVEILGHKHIVIFALRRILSGEELTYDYKFPFEEDKIPCTCGARRCRKFLN